MSGYVKLHRDLFDHPIVGFHVPAPRAAKGKRPVPPMMAWQWLFSKAAYKSHSVGNKGMDVSHIHVRHIWPLPENLGDLLRGFDHVLVPEMNTGQFKTVLRDQYLVDAQPLTKTSGQPFTIAELEAAIGGVLS